MTFIYNEAGTSSQSSTSMSYRSTTVIGTGSQEQRERLCVSYSWVVCGLPLIECNLVLIVRRATVRYCMPLSYLQCSGCVIIHFYSVLMLLRFQPFSGDSERFNITTPDEKVTVLIWHLFSFYV